jgi:hypothetical protein
MSDTSVENPMIEPINVSDDEKAKDADIQKMAEEKSQKDKIYMDMVEAIKNNTELEETGATSFSDILKNGKLNEHGLSIEAITPIKDYQFLRSSKYVFVTKSESQNYLHAVNCDKLSKSCYFEKDGSTSTLESTTDAQGNNIFVIEEDDKVNKKFKKTPIDVFIVLEKSTNQGSQAKSSGSFANWFSLKRGSGKKTKSQRKSNKKRKQQKSKKQRKSRK